MSYHIIDIGETVCSLFWQKGRIICTSSMGTRSIPLEDVASIIITSFKADISSNLFLEAGKSGISLIFCEQFKPVSILLPSNRSSDTKLTRAQISISAQLRKRLWEKTISVKCMNQANVVRELWPQETDISSKIELLAQGRSSSKEAECARLFWKIYGVELMRDEKFTRSRKAGGLNNLLNYAYAVLLSSTLQKLFGVGIDPTFGIGHLMRENATPLAYDLMEPFRPFFDAHVAAWVKSRWDWDDVYCVTKDYKAFIIPKLDEKIVYKGALMEMQQVLEAVIRSFRKSLLEQQSGYYIPWRRMNTKWDGS